MLNQHKRRSLVAAVVAALALALAGPAVAVATARRRPRSCSSPTTRSRSRRRSRRRSRSESGLTLRILQGGDANEMLNRALLTAGDPQGDVIFGIDDSVLSRALDGDLLEEYRSDELEHVDPEYADDRRARDADRPRRGLSQRRPRVVRRARRRAAPYPRRPHRAAVPRPARGRERGHLLPRARRSCSPPSRGSARTAGRATGASCARTASSPSTAGRRRTRSSSRAPPAAPASGRSSSPTRRAPQPR